MIEFKDLDIEGFGSILNMRFDLGSKGISIIRGGNGSGKTTIFNALIWCLFGVNLKGVVKSDLVSRIGIGEDFQGTRVLLSLEKDGSHYEILRHINYKGSYRGLVGGSKLLIFKDQELVPVQHNGDYQKYIIDLLGVTSEIFLNSVLFGQRMKRFIEADNKDKRSLFESIIDMTSIDKAREKCGEHLTNIQSQIAIKEAKISEIELKRVTSEEELSNYTNIHNVWRDGMTEKLEAQRSFIKEKEEAINSLKKPEQYLPDLPYSPTLDISIHSTGLDIKNLDESLANRPEISTEGKKSILKQIADNKIEQAALHLEEVKDDDFCELERVTTDLIGVEADLSRVDTSLATKKAPIYPTTQCSLCDSDLKEEKVKELIKLYKKKVENHDKEVKTLQGHKSSLTVELVTLKELHRKHQVINDRNRVKGIIRDENHKIQTKLDILQQVAEQFEQSLASYDKRMEEAVKIESKAVRDIKFELEESKKTLDSLLKQQVINVENKAFNEVQLFLKGQLQDYQRDVKNIQELIDHSQKLLKGLEKEVSPSLVFINRINDSLPFLADLLITLDKEKESLRTLEVGLSYWYSTGFTTKGMKGYITDAALALLNSSIFKYSTLLGMRIEFSIDTTKKSKPFITKCFNLRGDEFNYNEFSGGEKARLDVATAFAIHDLVSANTEFGTLIMDEIFEGLDESGVDDVFELIRLKAEDKNVFIITHSPHLDARNTVLIEVEKGLQGTVLK